MILPLASAVTVVAPLPEISVEETACLVESKVLTAFNLTLPFDAAAFAVELDVLATTLYADILIVTFDAWLAVND